MHDKACRLLAEAADILNQMDALERQDKAEFKPGVRVLFTGHPSFPHIKSYVGTLTKHMTIEQDNKSFGALVFDYEGRLVAYEKLGKMLKRLDQ